MSRKMGSRLGPYDILRFYRILYLKEKGLTSLQIGKIVGLGRQGVDYQISRHQSYELSSQIREILDVLEKPDLDPAVRQVLEEAGRAIAVLEAEVKQKAEDMATQDVAEMTDS